MTDIEKEAIDIVKKEYTSWEDATAFITEKIAFNMRPLIRKCIKNYYGIFDKPEDNQGNEKIWVHLTQEFVDSMRKNIDLDTKDVNFRAKHDSAIPKTKIVRSAFKNYLDSTYFGEDLDDLITETCITGTGVWETIEEYDKELGRKTAKRIRVPLLNVYIDPTSRSIQEAYRFTVRHLLTESEVKGMKGWINTETIEAGEGLSQMDAIKNSTNITGTSKYVDVWEMYGKAPKYLLTGKKEDKGEADLHIIASGLERAGSERIHLVETYNGTKPYEEMRLFRVPGRWYGMGVAEKLMMYQLWMNSVVNIRITRAKVSQLGIFKIKSTSGITPQMLARLAVNGAIKVNAMDDIEQMPMQEASQASYKDEEVIQNRAQRVTGTYEVATGENMPSSTPATNAVLQNNASQSGYTLIKEQIGQFLEKWIKRHALPIVLKNLKNGEIIRMELDPEDMRKFDEAQVSGDLTDQVEQVNQAGGFIDPGQVQMEYQKGMAQLRNYPDRYLRYTEQETIDCLMFDVEVVVTNEKIDKNVLSQNLMTMMQIAPEYKSQLLNAASDLWGVDIKVDNSPQMMPPEQMQQPGQPGQLGAQGALGAPANIPSQNPQEAVTNSINGLRNPAGLR